MKGNRLVKNAAPKKEKPIYDAIKIASATVCSGKFTVPLRTFTDDYGQAGAL